MHHLALKRFPNIFRTKVIFYFRYTYEQLRTNITGNGNVTKSKLTFIFYAYMLSTCVSMYIIVIFLHTWTGLGTDISARSESAVYVFPLSKYTRCFIATSSAEFSCSGLLLFFFGKTPSWLASLSRTKNFCTFYRILRTIKHTKHISCFMKKPSYASLISLVIR